MLLLLVAFIVGGSLGSVLGVTGSLGNSRMIWRLDIGDTEHRTLLVRNVNDFPITIEMSASGDLADSVKIEEETFTLAVGEERRAKFSLFVSKGGTTDTKINVKYMKNEEEGIGLVASIIVIAPEGDEIVDLGYDDSDNSGVIDKNLEDGKSGISPVMLLSLLTGVLVLVFIVLLVFISKKKKSVKRSSSHKNTLQDSKSLQSPLKRKVGRGRA